MDNLHPLNGVPMQNFLNQSEKDLALDIKGNEHCFLKHKIEQIAGNDDSRSNSANKNRN
jgi:hypothetical protein